MASKFISTMLAAACAGALAMPVFAQDRQRIPTGEDGTWVAKSGAKRVVLWGPADSTLIYRICLDGEAPLVAVHLGDKSFNVFAGACMDVVVSKGSLVIENTAQENATGTYRLVAP